MAQGPMLVAAPGMHVDQVLSLSSVALRPPDPSKYHGFVQPPGEPHRFRVQHEQHGFELPEGLFSLLETRYGIVQRLRATPHVDYVDTPTAVRVMLRIAEALELAGWKPKVEVDEAVTVEKLDRRLRVGLGPWHAGDWVAKVSARREVEKGSDRARTLQLDGHSHLVTMTLSDAKLLAQDERW